MVEGIVLKDQYNVLKEIGSGSFGKVYMVEDIKTKAKLAIKRINKKDIEESEYLYQAFWKELEIMKKCECEFSVKLFEHFFSSNFYNIVMELCDTDLDFVLNKRSKGFLEEEVKAILKQLNHVFMIMDRENIIHRDLKLRNIMVIMNKPDQINIQKSHPINFVTKLSDFGFSKVMDDDITRTKLGTPATMAPEILMNKNYSQKADMWSIGIITYQLLFKMLPYRARNEKELLNNIINHKGIKVPEGYKISETLLDLLKSLLQFDPNNRISWKQYFEHPFFNERIGVEVFPSQNFEKFEEKYVNLRKLSEEFSEYKLSKAKIKETGELVLIKEIARNVIDNNKINKMIFEKELVLMKKLNSDNFIKLIDFYKTNSHYYIVTEYFEGKILDNFLTSRKTLPENLVQQIVRSLAPAFKELEENKIVLDFVSTKSFCFKFYKNEDNFQIKFFDYGLSIIFTDVNIQREFLLNEAKFGEVNSQKTNVLSFGMVIYKLLFGETIYKFNINEDPEQTINKKKTIKLPKNISKASKHLIEKTCHLNKEKRYDWKSFLEDSFVRIKYGEDIKMSPSNNTRESLNVINDNKVENLAENLKSKIELIINYYNLLFTENEIELINNGKFFKEMSIFAMLMVLEIKLFMEFIKPKEKFYEDEELHLLKISKSRYDYSSCNFLKSGISINKENPMIDQYIKIFSNLENLLLDIVRKILQRIDINVDEVQSYDYIASSIKNYYSANIEKYFFKVFENGILFYSKGEYKEALNEFLISKYFCESIIFIRLISSNKCETEHFVKLFECLENEDELNLFSYDNKLKSNVKNPFEKIDFCNLIMFTFLGGIIKTFKSQKIIEDIESESFLETTNDSFESLIKFYPEIVKMIIECSESLKIEKNLKI